HIETVHATTFHEGSRKATPAQHGVGIIDVMIPGGSGFDLCRKLRQRGDTTPILMLTARTVVEDRVTGLEAGADDYLTKPFAFQELLARVRALSRRQPALVDTKCAVADLVIDMSSRRVERGGKP